MSIKTLFTLFLVIFALFELVFISFTLTFLFNIKRDEVMRGNVSDFDRIYNAYGNELAGNVLLDHKELFNTRLKEIENRENVSLRFSETDVVSIAKQNHKSQRSYPLTIGDRKVGSILIERPLIFVSKRDLFVTAGFTLLQLVFFSLLIYVSYRWAIRAVIRPVENILGGHLSIGSSESHFVPSEIKILARTHTSLVMEREKHARKSALAELAAQVAHDIRSPVAALNVVENNIQDLDDATRLLIRNATLRINEIAQDLLDRGHDSTAENISSSFLAGLVEAIFNEVIVRQKDKTNIQFELNFHKRSSEFFANINAAELKRILSNLINNSVEAIGDRKGKVSLNLTSKSDKIILSVKDTGPGIPPEILDRIFERGFTYGKIDGRGLGLSHAKHCIDAWGGEINLCTEINVGTEIEISLPPVAPPVWVQKYVNLKGIEHVVLVDDDSTIANLVAKQLHGSISFKHFDGTKDFLEQLPRLMPSNTVLFVDMNIRGSAESGIDVLDRAKYFPNRILFTSQYDDVRLQKYCSENNVTLFPKFLVKTIPFISA